MSKVSNQRSRDPAPPKAVCLRCGWTGTPNHTILRDEHGDPALVVSQKPCPICGAGTTTLDSPKRSLPVEIITAIREANLTGDELSAVGDAVRAAAQDVSPRELAEQVPAASKLITVASRAGENWLQLLALVVSIVAIYIAHADTQQAHRDAEEALRVARQAQSTAELSDDEVREIADRISAALDTSEGLDPSVNQAPRRRSTAGGAATRTRQCRCPSATLL